MYTHIPSLGSAVADTATQAASSSSVPPTSAVSAQKKAAPSFIYLSKHVFEPYATMNDVRTTYGIKNLHVSTRLPPVPLRDVGLSQHGFNFLHILPPSYPSFLSDACPIPLKINAAFDPRLLGEYEGRVHVVNISTSPSFPLTYLSSSYVQANGSDAAADSAAVEADESMQVDQGSSAAAPAAASAVSPASTLSSTLVNASKKYSFVYPYTRAIVHDVLENVYPMSVMLELRNDIQMDFERVNSWKKSIVGYRMCPSLELKTNGLSVRNYLAQHYVNNITHGQDPYFHCPLFGGLHNGLSVIMLALAHGQDYSSLIKTNEAKRRRGSNSSVAATSDEIDDDGDCNDSDASDILIDYIILVCIQFWSLINERWMELDPTSPLMRVQWKPSYLLYLFHAVDLGKELSHDKKSNPSMQPLLPTETSTIESLAALVRSTGVGIVAFIYLILDYVAARMQQLANDQSVDIHFRLICAAMNLSRRLDNRISKTLLKNHTQFFMCSHFKHHPVHRMEDITNQLFGSINIKTVSQEDIKFFPCHTKSLCLQVPMLKNHKNADRKEKSFFFNPYFWSHFTINPVSPIVSAQDDAITAPFAKNAAGVASVALAELHRSSNHLMALRHLVYCMKGESVLIIRNRMKNIPPVESCIRSVGLYSDQSGVASDDAAIAFQCDSSQFVHRFVSRKIMGHSTSKLSVRDMRTQTLNTPFLLKPIISPVDLRYAITMDKTGDCAYHYVPSLSRNSGQLSIFDESDIMSMSRQQFLFLWYEANAQQCDRFSVFKSGLCGNDKALSVQFYMNTFITKFGGKHGLLSLAGFDCVRKLFPSDRTSHVFYNVDRCRLNDHELKQLQLLTMYEQSEMNQSFVQFSNGEFNCYHLWTLLGHVVTSEEDRLFHYLPLASDQVYVNDRPMFTEESVLLLFSALQRVALYEKRESWSSFMARWTPLKSDRPYARAQDNLLSTVDLNWDRCHTPYLSLESLVEFIVACARHDTSRMKFCLVNIEQTKALSEKVKKPAISALDELMDKKLDHPLFLDINNEDVATACEIVIRDLYRAKRVDQAILFKQTKCNMSYMWCKFNPVQPSFADLDKFRIVFRCTDETSLLYDAFTQFFMDPAAKRRHTRYHFPIANIQHLVMFLLWNSYTHQLAPLKENLSILYPDSSFVSVGMHAARQSWPDRLKPIDTTRQVSKLQHQLISKLISTEFVAELKRVAKAYEPISMEAVAVLSSVYALTRIQTDVNVDNDVCATLVRVDQYISNILSRVGQLQTDTTMAITTHQFQHTQLQEVISKHVGVLSSGFLIFQRYMPAYALEIWKEMVHIVGGSKALDSTATCYWRAYQSATNHEIRDKMKRVFQGTWKAYSSVAAADNAITAAQMICARVAELVVQKIQSTNL
jgi:hypothetical protein